jgi:hypothetical protein
VLLAEVADGADCADGRLDCGVTIETTAGALLGGTCESAGKILDVAQIPAGATCGTLEADAGAGGGEIFTSGTASTVGEVVCATVGADKASGVCLASGTCATSGVAATFDAFAISGVCVTIC